MDIQWLLTFDKILKTGTYAKATEELGYTQSTVTFQIRQLEQELNIKLFDKISRKMQLSEAGRAVVPLIRETIESSERLKHAGQENNRLVGKITIAVSDSIFRVASMYDVVARFLEEAPNIDLTVTRKACSDTVEALKNGGVDIGIFYQVDGLEDPALTITRLKDIHMILAASGTAGADWDMAQPPTKIPFFITDSRCAFHGVYKRYLKHRGLPSHNDIVLNDWASSLRAIESGTGISLIPRETVEKELAAGSIRAIPMDDLQETAYVALALHKNKGRSPAIDLFTKLVQQYFEERF